MVCGDIPFVSDKEISTARLVWFPQLKLSNQVKDLISRCLTLDPDKRITLDRVRDSAWLRGEEGGEWNSQGSSSSLYSSSPSSSLSSSVRSL
eukprot:GFUD01071958.1.p1 GENE.GFUD01071958.1~~GFUD01071958.1.p1  ORF type:complete len:103 (-),score=16.62 GFUD01071958.1:102-377(-)